MRPSPSLCPKRYRLPPLAVRVSFVCTDYDSNRPRGPSISPKGDTLVQLLSCALCDILLNEDNESREHIIPMAIGGRKTVTGFLCRNCNGLTGRNWDSQVAGQLNLFGLLLGTKRQKGNLPSMRLPTASGDELQLGPNNAMTLTPMYEKTTEGASTRIRIRARSVNEMRRRIEELVKDYPHLDIEEVMSRISVKQAYINDPMVGQLQFGGPEARKSMVKSVVALAYSAGISANNCDLALDYLKNVDAKPCFYPCYGMDVLLDRDIRTPLHCVYVTGDAESRYLLGYVEYYGVIRGVVCLSKAYKGRSFSKLYAMDPTSGNEERVVIELNEDTLRAVESQTDEVTQSSMLEAITHLVHAGQTRAQGRELERVLSVGWDNWLYESGKKEGEVFTEDDAKRLVDHVMASLTPFLLHVLTPMDIPPGTFQKDA